MKAQPLLPAALKRRRGPRVAVLALVLCSLLVPLAFLFDRAPSGRYPTLSSLARSLPRNAHWVGSAGAAALGSPPLRRWIWRSSSPQWLVARPVTARPC